MAPCKRRRVFSSHRKVAQTKTSITFPLLNPTSETQLAALTRFSGERSRVPHQLQAYCNTDGNS